MSASPVFVGDGTISVATTAPSEKTLYALGEPVTVPALTRAHDDVAGQRLQRSYYSDGEKRYVDERMYDTENDTECQVNVLADGTIVCLPLGFIRVGLIYFGPSTASRRRYRDF